MSGPVFSQALYIGVSADEVWQAIVEPEVVKKYHFIPLRTLELRKGGQIIYGEGEEHAIAGEILEIEPGTRLVHTFRFGHRLDESPSRVTYEIKPMGKMCELALTHDGFTDDAATYQDICGGWPVILSGLKTLMETGTELPWPKPQSGE